MTDTTLLSKIGELFIVHTAQIRKEIKESEERIKKELREEVKEIVKRSQEDTIQVLSDQIHTGYNMHEKRIKRVEDHLQLPPIQ